MRKENTSGETPKSELLFQEMKDLTDELLDSPEEQEDEWMTTREKLKPIVLKGTKVLHLSADRKRALQEEEKLTVSSLTKTLVEEQAFALYMSRRMEPYVNNGNEIQGYEYALQSMQYFYNVALDSGRALNELLIIEINDKRRNTISSDS